jgi:hypothetical protein
MKRYERLASSGGLALLISEEAGVRRAIIGFHRE